MQCKGMRSCRLQTKPEGKLGKEQKKEAPVIGLGWNHQTGFQKPLMPEQFDKAKCFSGMSQVENAIQSMGPRRQHDLLLHTWYFLSFCVWHVRPDCAQGHASHVLVKTA